jgi:flagellin
MSTFSILNNIPSMMAENEVNTNNTNLQSTLLQLSSGSRINSGADDPAGLAIANGLNANIAALNQSVQNVTDGVGQLQVADGALSQVTSLLNSAITLATESSNGTLSSTQRLAIDNQFQSINSEINSIGASTTYNGTSVFTASASSIFLSDSSSAAANITIATTTGVLSSTSVGGTTMAFGGDNLQTAGASVTALADINTAISTVASLRGTIGANINRLNDATNVANTQVENLTSAENGITAANIPQVVSDMSKFQILTQTGMAALAQANSSQQSVLKLLQ